VSPVPALVTQPRPFGYVVGDLIEQRVLLQADQHGLQPASLPRPGRVNVWLERRAARIASDSQGRDWLVVEYQLINAPQGLTTVNIPTWTLNTRTGEVLSVAPWPLSVGPLTARTVISQGGLQELRADRPAPAIPTDLIIRQIDLWAGAFVLTLLLWAGWLAWRNWRAALNQPFARAAREMRGVADDAPQAWQALHRAFDRTAGRVVQGSTLASLFERARYLEPLRPRIEAFFAQSAEYFFDAAVPRARQRLSVHALCSELRQFERRYHQ
jgi:mxaA protein